MKKMIALGMAAIMCLSMTACSVSTSSKTETTAAATEAAETTAEAAKDSETTAEPKRCLSFSSFSVSSSFLLPLQISIIEFPLQI